MKGPMAGLMRQAQKMQEDLQKAQGELENITVTGESGGGMVSVTLNGKHQCKKVQIELESIGDDQEMLEDLIVAAMNDAVAKVAEASQEHMGQVTAGIPLPPGMKLPF